jgi:hypothetical protein
MERAKLLFQPRQVGAQALIEPLSLAVKWRDQGDKCPLLVQPMQPKTAFPRFPLVPGADLKGQLRVEAV